MSTQLQKFMTPSWCRWDRENPHTFTIWHNLLYAAAGGVFSANLYYSHPILEVMANAFGTDQAGVANIPTLAQAGDATGLILVLPLVDFFPRRYFSLFMLTVTIAFWIGLCITRSLVAFQVFTYLSAVTTSIIQILLVLVAELSTPEKRAFNISIVATGPTLGILIARILSGLVANYTAWRNVYWMALGMQIVILALMYLFMPNYPASNPKPAKDVAKQYPNLLIRVIHLFVKHPALTQAGILSFLTFFTVSSFWTTLTFLLSGPPYQYSTVVIGLVGLIGATTLVLGPLFARYIVQPLRLPLLSAAVGVTFSLVGIVIGTFVGRTSFAGPVVQAILLDAGLMILQVSNRMEIHDIEPKSRNSVNTVFVTYLYLGMLCGTKAGNVVYQEHGGWLASGGLNIGIIALSYVIILARGPRVRDTVWFGWEGGWRRNKKNDTDVESDTGPESDEVEVEEKEKEKSVIASAETDVVVKKKEEESR